MGKQIVAYFSASGVTANAAKALAGAVGADLYEIKPAIPYTAADLDWTNRKSRSSVEMADPTFRPPVAGNPPDMAPYDVMFLGFPIWWGTAPSIVKTFLEGSDLSGKTIVLFATSGGNGLGNTAGALQAICPGASVRDGRLLNGRQTKEELAAWGKSLSL